MSKKPLQSVHGAFRSFANDKAFKKFAPKAKKAVFTDGDIAQARRYYHHFESGGVLKLRDVGRMVEYLEARQAENQRLKDEIERLENDRS